MSPDARRRWGALGLAALAIVSLIVVATAQIWAGVGPPLTPAAVAFPLPFAAFSVVGALVVWRLPRHRLGWLMCSLGLCMLLGLALIVPGFVLAPRKGAGGLLGAGIYQVGHSLTTVAFAIAVILLLLYPTGSPAGRFQRVLLALPSVGAALVVTAQLVDEPFLYGDGSIANPFQLPWRVPVLAFFATPASFTGLGLALLVAALSLVLRYRVSDTLERLQIKWFAFAVAAAAVFTAVDGVIQAVTGWGSAADSVATLLYSVGWMSAVIAIGLAIVRHRLWAIDRLLSKSLTYGGLVGLIVTAYAGLIAALGTLAGHAVTLPAAVALTIIVAIAFQPARLHLQRLADRLVYGPRGSPYEVLADFMRRTSRSLEPCAVASLMARVAGEGVSADEAAAWIRRGSDLELVAVWPDGRAVDGRASATHKLDVTRGELLLGRLAIWRSGPPLSATERRLLDDLARQAAVVFEAVRLDEELRIQVRELPPSRQRLTEAQDRERRRLERDIHDGAQQQLVALSTRRSNYYHVN